MFSNGNIRFYIMIAITVILVKLAYVLFKKYAIKESRHHLYSWMIIALSIGGCIYFDELAVKKYGDQIGSFFEHTGYTAEYYVNVFEGAYSSKNYELTAQIHRDEETGNYLIQTFTWPNGGGSEFDNYNYDNPLILGERVWIKDDNNKLWYIQLTDKKVK